MHRVLSRLRSVVFWGGPFLLPAAAAYYIYAAYDELPERFPIHWTSAGRPDLWIDKSVQGVFFGPVIATLLMLFTLLAAWLMFVSSRSSLQPNGAVGVRRVGLLNWLLGALFAATSVLPGFVAEKYTMTAWPIALCVFSVVVVSVFTMLKVKR
jgi:uncharacterized membrane protein